MPYRQGKTLDYYVSTVLIKSVFFLYALHVTLFRVWGRMSCRARQICPPGSNRTRFCFAHTIVEHTLAFEAC